MSPPKIVKLNVGGRPFTTKLTTLTSFPDSMLAKMFQSLANGEGGRASLPPAERDETGAYFIDSDPGVFEIILDFLRTGRFFGSGDVDPERLLAGAEYFGLDGLAKAVKDKLDEERRGKPKKVFVFDFRSLITRSKTVHPQEFFSGGQYGPVYTKFGESLNCVSYEKLEPINVFFRESPSCLCGMRNQAVDGPEAVVKVNRWLDQAERIIKELENSPCYT